MLIQDSCALTNSQEYMENDITQSIENIIPITHNAPCSKGRTFMNGPPKSFYWYSWKMYKVTALPQTQ